MSVEVFVSYNNFQLLDHDDAAFPDPVALGDSDGLLCAFERGGMVLTGIDMGPVLVSVEALDTEPPLDLDRWEEVTDVSFNAPHGYLSVVPVIGTENTEYMKLPALTAHGPGVYRVRCSANGRTRALKAIVQHPVEEFLLQAWPEPPSPSKSHRLLIDRFHC